LEKKMHSETIDDRLVAVEKIDSQKPIHARSSNSATKVRKIPRTHGMCTRLVEPNLKIFDFAGLNIFTGQPHHTIDILFSFCERQTERPQERRRNNSLACSCIDDQTGGAPVEFARDVKFVTRPFQRQRSVALFY